MIAGLLNFGEHVNFEQHTYFLVGLFSSWCLLTLKQCFFHFLCLCFVISYFCNVRLCSIAQPIVFKSVFEILSSLSDSINIFIKKEGLDCLISDISLVFLVHIELNKQLFLRYFVNDESTVSIKLDELVKSFKTVRNEDTVLLSSTVDSIIVVCNSFSTFLDTYRCKA